MTRNLDRGDDLFGGPQGSPRTDKMIAAAVQWAELIMEKVDATVGQPAMVSAEWHSEFHCCRSSVHDLALGQKSQDA